MIFFKYIYHGKINLVAKDSTEKQQITLKKFFEKLLTCIQKGDKINKSLKGDKLNGL